MLSFFHRPCRFFLEVNETRHFFFGEESCGIITRNEIMRNRTKKKKIAKPFTYNLFIYGITKKKNWEKTLCYK